MKIGLTCSLACGKSTVSGYLRSLGYPVVDADAISRALTTPGGAALPAVRAAFGDRVVSAGGALDRRALGRHVFDHPDALAQLNAILHPMILREIAAQLSALEATHGTVFGDVPLLFECGMQPQFDRIWVVSASRETQLARLAERDGLTEAEAAARIDAQMPLAKKRCLADAVISTEGPIEQTQAQVRRLLDAISTQRRQP